MSIEGPKLLDIQKRYSSHIPDREGVDKMRTIRRHVRALANSIEIICPDGRAKATAFTQLDTVMMYANSAIASSYPLDPEDN